MGVFYLIRHGKTKANENHLYCGSTDLPLSESGMEELRGLHYSVPENSVFLTSGMKRTEQTLALLFGKVAHKAATDFCEIDFGRFEMKSYEQLKDDPEYQAWISRENEQKIPPGGESGAQMLRRVLAGWEALQSETAPVVLISHGGVIAALMAALFPEEGKCRYEWQPQPGHGYRIDEHGYQELRADENII